MTVPILKRNGANKLIIKIVGLAVGWFASMLVAVAATAYWFGAGQASASATVTANTTALIRHEIAIKANDERISQLRVSLTEIGSDVSWIRKMMDEKRKE